MSFADRQNKITRYLKEFGRITSQELQSLAGVHRNTALKDLKFLVQDGTLQSFGKGKGTYYQLAQQLLFTLPSIEKIFSKNNRTRVARFFRQAHRKPVFFDRVHDRALSADFSLPQEFDQKVQELKTRVIQIKKELSPQEQKRKKQRLVVDLSWASSYIEGNTYSRLETENLIENQETAHGKKYFEAKMILNHKQAIDYIRQYGGFKKLSVNKIYELHQILVEDLDIQTGLRKHLVRISNSAYVPCDNEFQIRQTLDEIILLINKEPATLNKAIMGNLLLAFLQPFADGNKRTSRMLGNAILVSHGLLPISFSHTPRDEYLKSVLYFYEKQDTTYFTSLFLRELNASFMEYIG